mmetsp:Transcript_25373/g.58431  ORF Transcript_25373/g.58431 Transcript_25373/m.58431 type:complete len:338 (-) Transcript_25373:3841-4854(-)
MRRAEPRERGRPHCPTAQVRHMDGEKRARSAHCPSAHRYVVRHMDGAGSGEESVGGRKGEVSEGVWWKGERKCSGGVDNGSARGTSLSLAGMGGIVSGGRRCGDSCGSSGWAAGGRGGESRPWLLRLEWLIHSAGTSMLSGGKRDGLGGVSAQVSSTRSASCGTATMGLATGIETGSCVGLMGNGGGMPARAARGTECTTALSWASPLVDARRGKCSRSLSWSAAAAAMSALSRASHSFLESDSALSAPRSWLRKPAAGLGASSTSPAAGSTREGALVTPLLRAASSSWRCRLARFLSSAARSCCSLSSGSRSKRGTCSGSFLSLAMRRARLDHTKR